MADYVWGILCVLFGNLAGNLGMTLQKLSMRRHFVSKTGRMYLKQPLWWIGFLLYVVGQVFEGMAFGLAAQSLVATLSSVYIVYNIIFAAWILKEKFSPKVDFTATVAIIGGTIVTALNSKHDNTQYSLDQLMALYRKPSVIAYLVVTFVSCIAVFITCKWIHYTAKRDHGGDVYKLSRVKLHTLRLFYTSFGAILGGPSVLMVKAVAEMFKYSIRQHENQFESVVPAFMAAYVILTSVLQVHYLQVALKYFDALYVVPVRFVVWTITVIVGGGVYYSEFDDLSTREIALFSVGVALTLFGVYLVSMRRLESSGGGSSSAVDSRKKTEGDDEGRLFDPDTVYSDEMDPEQAANSSSVVLLDEFHAPASSLGIEPDRIALLQSPDGKTGAADETPGRDFRFPRASLDLRRSATDASMVYPSSPATPSTPVVTHRIPHHLVPACTPASPSGSNDQSFDPDHNSPSPSLVGDDSSTHHLLGGNDGGSIDPSTGRSSSSRITQRDSVSGTALSNRRSSRPETLSIDGDRLL